MRYIVSIAILLSCLSLYSQDVQFTASAKQTVAVGETFTLMYTVNKEASGFRGPNLQGFGMLSGPNTSTSSSIRSVNGRTTMTITYSFTYLLQAIKEGSFDIAAASVNVDGRQYASNTLNIKVVKNPNVPAGQNPALLNKGQSGSGAATSGGNDVFVKAFASNSNPIQGEGVVITYKIYTKVQISGINISKAPAFPGFWSQNLTKDNDKLQPTTQMIDGEQYLVADIRKYALYPLKAGKLIVDPMELTCVAQVRKQTKTRTGDPFFDDFFNDSFFNSGIANVEKNLKSNPLIINARPLPEEEKPADFSGAVGNFTFQTEVDKSRLKTNEAVTLKCTVSGKGNIQLIDKMNVVFPPDFENYDPKVTSDIQTTAAGITGNQIFEYLLIPRKPGKFTIKPINFAYYDLAKKRYITLTSPEFTLDVEKGTGESQAMVTYAGANKEEIKYIGSDIRHIKDGIIALKPAGKLFFGSPGFWMFLTFPFLIFMVFLLFWRKLAARRNDTILMKNLKATKIARKHLRKAEGFWKSGAQEDFYVAISQALWGYLSDKFTIPLSDLSISSVHDALLQKNVSEQIITQFIDTLNNTEFARFAPGEKMVNMERIYNEALEIITNIERELR